MVDLLVIVIRGMNWKVMEDLVKVYCIIMSKLLCKHANFVQYFAIDIDECTEGLSKCHQICKNTNGSYQCDCDGGYKLRGDNFTCIGTYSCTLINIYPFIYSMYVYGRY